MEFEVKFFPTRLTFPTWCPPSLARRACRTLSIGTPRIKRIRELPTFRGLSRSPLMPEIEPFIDPLDRREEILAGIETDGVEVVDWMLDSWMNAVALSARETEYNLAGSQMTTGSGDGYIPGVKAEDIHAKKQRGRDVSRQGYFVLVTPRGNTNVPRYGKATAIFKDLLAWGSNTYLGSVQYGANLIKWKELASTPIRRSIGFFKDSRGHVAPNFFVQRPSRPAMSVTARLSIDSNDNQTININFRDPTDYTRVSGSKSFDVAKGTHEVTFTLTALPFVPPVVAEIQPEDGVSTSLNSYDTIP